MERLSLTTTDDIDVTGGYINLFRSFFTHITNHTLADQIRFPTSYSGIYIQHHARPNLLPFSYPESDELARK